MFGGYEGGWNPGPFLAGDYPKEFYETKSGHQYMDIKDWALRKWNTDESRDAGLKMIYLSAKAMKFHPHITKDLKKVYGLLASAAMRAMSPEGKWKLKREYAPYNAAKKHIASKVKELKAELGIADRSGEAGRIAYWNRLFDMGMDDAGVPAMLTGTAAEITGKPYWEYTGDYVPTTYQAYKAALKARMANRRAILDRMTDDQRKEYKHRLRVYQNAKKRASDARKAAKERIKSNPAIAFAKVDPLDYEGIYTTAVNEAVDEMGEKYADVDKASVVAALHPKASLFNAYAEANRGILNQELRRQPDTQMLPVSLTQRNGQDWTTSAALNNATTGMQGLLRGRAQRRNFANAMEEEEER